MRGLYVRSILVSLSLVGAVSILGVSLFAGNAQVWSTNGNYDASNRQMYWSKDILPDHVAYPALMVADRAKLEIAEPVDRVYLQLEYGRRRYESAEALLEKGNSSLALTTLTKAQKYWLQAGYESLSPELEHSETVRFFTLRTIDFYNAEIEEQKIKFTDAERAVVDSLQAELRVVAAQLETTVVTSE